LIARAEGRKLWLSDFRPFSNGPHFVILLGTETAQSEEEIVLKGVTPLVKGLLIAAAIVAVIGCSGQPLSTREKGTFIGTGVGAATGAIIGAAVGAPLAGAAIGGGIGAVGGYAVGNAMQNQDHANAQTQAQISSQQKELQSQKQEIQRLKSQKETE
jgi:uncharacterized membrane protein